MPLKEIGLKKGVLGLTDVVISGLANMGPAMSLFFSISYLAESLGKAVPFEILLAGLAILTLGNTLAEFTKSIPSAGSFITFIEQTFGHRVATACSLTLIVGYVMAISGVNAALGGWVANIFERDLGLHLPWLVIVVMSNVLITMVLLKGVKVSSFWAIVFFVFETLVLLLLSAVIFYRGGVQGLSLAPFSPAGLGIGALAASFPLAVFMFVGWENSGALAEETEKPQRNVPRAVFSGILLIASLYILSSYSAVMGFGSDHVAQLAEDSAPYSTLGLRYLGSLHVLVDLAGLTSIIATIVAAANSQTRILYNAGRSGMLPSLLSRVNGKYQTPHVAIIVYMVSATVLVVIFGWKLEADTCFGYFTTLGTIPLILMYALSNVALPFYYRRVHPEQFRWLRHLLVPMLGLALLISPFWGLVQPGQPYPQNWFPWIILGLVVASIFWTLLVARKERLSITPSTRSVIPDE